MYPVPLEESFELCSVTCNIFHRENLVYLCRSTDLLSGSGRFAKLSTPSEIMRNVLSLL